MDFQQLSLSLLDRKTPCLQVATSNHLPFTRSPVKIVTNHLTLPLLQSRVNSGIGTIDRQEFERLTPKWPAGVAPLRDAEERHCQGNTVNSEQLTVNR
jgi:hypothetical protein